MNTNLGFQNKIKNENEEIQKVSEQIEKRNIDMKKVFTLCVLMSLVFAGSAFAVDQNTALLATSAQGGSELVANAPVGATIGRCSKGVRIGVQFNSGSYAMTTVHINGSKYYGTAFDSTAIFVNTPAGDINASFAAPTTSVSDTSFTSAAGWSSL